MHDTMERVVTTKEAAHEAATQAYQHARSMIENGNPARIICEEWQDDISVKQRKFLHGPVLGQISEQVRMPDGTRYVMKVWKEYARERFLGDRWEVIEVPGKFTKSGKPFKKRRKVRVSTEDLGIKAYSNYIDTVIDTFVTEFNVVFEFKANEREEVRWKRKAPAKHAEEAEACAA